MIVAKMFFACSVLDFLYASSALCSCSATVPCPAAARASRASRASERSLFIPASRSRIRLLALELLVVDGRLRLGHLEADGDRAATNAREPHIVSADGDKAKFPATADLCPIHPDVGEVRCNCQT